MTTKNLISKLNLGALPQETQEELLLSLGDLVFRQTLLRLIDKMDKTARTEFAVLLADNAPPEAVEAFLKERVPGADEALTETLSDLASDFHAAKV